ncbi:Aste57867_21727 [Aphanomyces stellatus]|uniref:Aste57867_21727 protein n=1 Tax=Aphanomyces stellatus TaxID=120398 RepID=A0A485LJM1_9STRA|nr:hypothetical protein As57867_021658 [Aphanomyces stellatus]VFT98396.1 Aste57867_21727 [Aphanomyces stellatus]
MQSALPHDVLFQIALATPDAPSFFALLDALHSSNALAPLHPFLALRSTHDIHDLWPVLCLSNCTGAALVHFQAIAPFCRHVVVLDDTVDLGLCQHISCDATLTWRDFPAYDNATTRQWYAEWSTLQVTHVVVDSCGVALVPLLDALPTLRHLVGLEVGDMVADNDIARVLGVLAKCATLTTLHLHRINVFTRLHDSYPTSSMVQNVTAWLETQPARTILRLRDWQLNSAIIDDATAQAFCKALSTCPTLEVFECIDCDFSHMNLPRLDEL